jgi:phosphohistidine phosphatase
VATQLWLLRHGEAEPHGERPDEQRRLTERGEDQSRAAGRALAALDLRFHLVFTSPRVRALETARLALEALGTELVVHDPLGGGFDADEALALAASAGEDQRTLIVGHNPDFEQVIHDLTGAEVELKKGGIGGIRLTGARRGELVALLRPREIDRLAATTTG